MDPEWENPNGVPISAWIFGGKRKETFPLVTEASSWEQGIFLASCCAKDTEDGLTPTPFGITPFLGCNINHYMKNWVEIRQYSGYNIPKVFVVNWFREGANGQLLWPGFRENSRVLKWIHSRVSAGFTDGVQKTPIGLIPELRGLDLRGCHAKPEEVSENLVVRKSEWMAELERMKKLYEQLGSEVPEELKQQLVSITEEFEFF